MHRDTIEFQRTYTGECQCGCIVYEINEQPIMLYACHCTDCQKQSASAFGLSLWVPRKAFSLITGEPRFWQTQAESGSSKLCAFCESCGSRIYHTEDHQSPVLSIKAGLVSGARYLRPVAHLWLRSAQPWVVIDTDDCLAFEKGVDDYAELIKRWQQSEQKIGERRRNR
ncbi:MAG: aldehyde-activating protein [Gammaproteobacteria bacterium]|nr:aldehyde-activating protein [Gammaproteobacteria bacterium]